MSVFLLGVACSREPVATSEGDTPRVVAQAVLNDGAEVHNHVYTQAWGTGWAGRVYLPGVELWVRNAVTSVDSVRVRSDAHGFFGVPRQPAGTYRLCWSALGYGTGCQSATFVLGDETFVMPEHLRLTSLNPLVWGRVLFRGGGVPRVQRTFLGVDTTAQVWLVDAATQATVSSVVQVNAQGQYAVGDAPAGTWSVVARVEAEQASGAVQTGSGVVQRDLTFRNSEPVLRAPVAWRGARAVRRVLPGEVVRLKAVVSDVDGDALTWRWVAAAGSGTVSGQGAEAEWTLPAVGGRFSAWAVVSDGRGGVSTREVQLSTQGPLVRFGGQVLDESTGGPLPGARVRVGGQETVTNAQGGFQLQLSEADRYVLTISANGYQLLSRVLLDERPQGQFRLVRAQPFFINPQQDNILQAATSAGQRPVQLTLLGGSLVDSAGQPAQGSLYAMLSPIDLSDPVGRMPGDLSALTREGQVVTLTSFGALDVNIFDAQGRRYNLRPGMPALVSFPINPKQAEMPNGPPASMPLWFYDEQQGVWRDEGTLRRSGDSYVGTVPHFSVFNADIAYTGGDCMRVHIDTARLPVPLSVRLTIPNGTGTPTVYTTVLDAALNAITRLPASTVIKIEVLDSSGNVISTATANPSTGIGTPGASAITVPYPYTLCTSDVTLTMGVPSGGTFLDNFGPGDATAAATYYAAIDPAGDKLTLADWKTENGFGVDDAAAYYFNNGDLGFGRSMHMKRSGTNRAFYVTNHASVDLAIFNVAPIATVAMEYSPHPTLPGGAYTKFYVFDAAGNRVDRADLDGNGDKYVPHLCNVCHAGDPFTADVRGDTNARFIPFDLESYRYSTIESPVGSGLFPFSRLSQEPQFKELNKAVLETNVTTTIQELVQGWYGGVTLPVATQNSTYVQPNWAAAGKSNEYLQVQAPSCRACHSTREGQLSWRYWSLAGAVNDFQERGSIYFAVCSSRRMPHAKRTHTNFWLSTSPHQPNVLGNAGISGWTPADPCPL